MLGLTAEGLRFSVLGLFGSDYYALAASGGTGSLNSSHFGSNLT